MDFINGLPNSNDFNVIFLLVDCLSKYGHFMALKYSYTTKVVAEDFRRRVFKLHGIPKSIVSNRDPIFLSSF